jgi:hypothetical protein
VRGELQRHIRSEGNYVQKSCHTLRPATGHPLRIHKPKTESVLQLYTGREFPFFSNISHRKVVLLIGDKVYQRLPGYKNDRA